MTIKRPWRKNRAMTIGLHMVRIRQAAELLDHYRANLHADIKAWHEDFTIAELSEMTGYTVEEILAILEEES